MFNITLIVKMWSKNGIIVINVDKINFTIDIIRKIKVQFHFCFIKLTLVNRR